MFDSEMICSHFGLEKVLFFYHSVDIYLHNLLAKIFVIKDIIKSVFVKKNMKFILLEITAELIESSFKLLKTHMSIIT
jgi:hypothetical protein